MLRSFFEKWSGTGGFGKNGRRNNGTNGKLSKNGTFSILAL